MRDADCLCGHERELHEHYRAHTDCASCGPEGCKNYRRRTWWRTMIYGPGAATPAAVRAGNRRPTVHAFIDNLARRRRGLAA